MGNTTGYTIRTWVTKNSGQGELTSSFRGDGLVYIERAVKPEDLTNLNWYNRLGGSWTYVNGHAMSYNGHGNIGLKHKALIRIEDIDYWDLMIRSAWVDGDEAEIDTTSGDKVLFDNTLMYC